MKKEFEVEVLKLGEAFRIANDENATEEQVAAALIIMEKWFKEFKTARECLTVRHNKNMLNHTLFSQAGDEVLFSNFDGDGIGVITEERTVRVIDMVGIHQDAQPVITAKYSSPIYAEIFTPTARTTRKAVSKLYDEGRLPNGSKRVTDAKIIEQRMFDFKSPDKE